MKKICTKCSIEKEIHDFNKRTTSKDGYGNQCRECNKNNLKKHYGENKQYYKNKAKKYWLDFRDYINNYKENKGCSLCGEKRHWVLDFHHTDENKEYNISDIVHIQSYSKLNLEIEKCDVLCSNCHRDLHYQQRKNIDKMS